MIGSMYSHQTRYTLNKVFYGVALIVGPLRLPWLGGGGISCTKAAKFFRSRLYIRAPDINATCRNNLHIEFFSDAKLLISRYLTTAFLAVRQAVSAKRNFYRQMDLFETSLEQYGCVNLCKSVCVDSDHDATNSSIIERGFSALNALKTQLRNRLLLKQRERLLVVGAALPDDLDSFEYDKMLVESCREMS